jgi:hypothetical protein
MPGLAHRHHVDNTREEHPMTTNRTTTYEICWRCQGHGVHDAWSGGMSAMDMAEEGQDFIDDYRAGAYNVTCTVCHGQRVLAVTEAEAEEVW